MGDPQLFHDVLSGDPLLLTPQKAAQVLRIGRTTIYALMKAGELRAVHIGRSRRLPRAELERYVGHLGTPPLPPPARARGRQRRTTTDQGELFDLVQPDRRCLRGLGGTTTVSWLACRKGAGRGTSIHPGGAATVPQRHGSTTRAEYGGIMPKPTMLAVDDDPQVLASISRDLRSRYAGEYRIMRASSGQQALEILAELALRARPVALVLSDQRMPGMSGVQLLTRAREHARDAKFLLLTAYADTDAAIAAINEVGLDYYLQKPWDPPEDRLFPVIDDLLGDWRRDHPEDTGDVKVVGHRWSRASHELKTFLSRNHVQYQWLELERDEEAQRLAGLAGAGLADLPLVLVPDAEPLRAPSILALAEALGLRTRAEQPLYDVCIVGAGPAGLAAAVYAASEGLRVVVVEKEAPGGQAGQSASIQNYLGFPKGLSGADLAHRATAQAARFGAEMLLARDVVSLEARGPVRAVRFAGSEDIEARAVVVASGVSYRRLQAPGLEEWTGRGVFYGSSASEASQCRGDDVYIVGAANSAGQAALNFARYAKRVVMLVRGGRLEDSMSMYLVDQIQATDNIEVRLGASVVAARGTNHLEAITIATGEDPPQEAETSWLFVYIGAAPRTDWLGDAVVRDSRGFIVTGTDLIASNRTAWPLARAPYALESSVPGVFAAGDVRLDSMKRVASAVGEGAMTVYLVHRYLASM